MSSRPPKYTKVVMARHATAAHLATPNIVAGRAHNSELVIPEGASEPLEPLLLGEKWRKQGWKPDAAHASPLLRAVQTMDGAIRGMRADNLCVVMEPRLQELCLGAKEGQDRETAYPLEVKQQIARLGSKYVHPGENAAREAGESEWRVAQRMASYLISQRLHREPFAQIVTVSHHVGMKMLHSYIEMDGLTEPEGIDPIAIHNLFVSRPPIEPCAQSLFVLEGNDRDTLKCHVEYIGQPLAEV